MLFSFVLGYLRILYNVLNNRRIIFSEIVPLLSDQVSLFEVQRNNKTVRVKS